MDATLKTTGRTFHNIDKPPGAGDEHDADVILIRPCLQASKDLCLSPALRLLHAAARACLCIADKRNHELFIFLQELDAIDDQHSWTASFPPEARCSLLETTIDSMPMVRSFACAYSHAQIN